KRNHPGSKLRQGFWMVFRLGVNNWGFIIKTPQKLDFFCLTFGGQFSHWTDVFLYAYFDLM
ncbi:hypothetical protein L2928_10225, partial [Streptococcus pneumoniae]|nr:hypothetical protein [Streptococcus pneumoniae]